MNAQQMQELCRELVDTVRDLLAQMDYSPWMVDEVKAVQFAITKAEQAFNPTPNATGCVESAATVPAFAGTGDTVKALGVGPVCPVCGAGVWVKLPSGEDVFHCGKCSTVECSLSEHLAITRAKQLAEAENTLRYITDLGGMDSNDGAWCADIAQDYFRNKPKEPTA